MRVGGIFVLFGSGEDCNSYVINGKEKAIIDPGMTGKESALKELGLGHADFNVVLLTHAHYDHCAAAQLYCNARVLTHKSAIKNGMLDERTMIPELFGTEAPKIKASQLPRSLDFGTTKFHAIHTPGHTKDSVSFHCAEQGILICGDLCFQGGYSGRTDYSGGSEKEMIESLSKVAKLSITHVLPGHGPLGTKSDIIAALRQL